MDMDTDTFKMLANTLLYLLEIDIFKNAGFGFRLVTWTRLWIQEKSRLDPDPDRSPTPNTNAFYLYLIYNPGKSPEFLANKLNIIKGAPLMKRKI